MLTPLLYYSNTRAFFCETVSNPSLEICDLETIATLAHEKGVPVIADSTFSTPYLCKPFDFGVDIIVSLTCHEKTGFSTYSHCIFLDLVGFILD